MVESSLCPQVIEMTSQFLFAQMQTEAERKMILLQVDCQSSKVRKIVVAKQWASNESIARETAK